VPRDRAQEVDVTEHLHRHLFVDANPLELLLGKLPRLVQQLIRNDELADVVHQRGEAQPLRARRREVELLGDVPGVHRDTACMTGGVRILLFERVHE
jgi:hypothetical protein